MTQALLVIDVQNDYFPGGQFTLWNTDTVLENIERAMRQATVQGIPVILVQHVASSRPDGAPFFNAGTHGVDIHPRVLAAAPQAPVVIKQFADSFEQTTLEQTLTGLGVTELLICGMMTHNCVTHTAISKAAEKYAVRILADCCTTVSEIMHQLALHALSTRVPLLPLSAAFQQSQSAAP